MLVLVAFLLLGSCSVKERGLRFGIISPSFDHLPLSYALQDGWQPRDGIEPVYFNSGWEVQESLISGKIDAAIMPFSYAYTAASRDYPIRIVSFLERESDAVVCGVEISSPEDLQGAKIGILKASSVDLLMRDWADRVRLSYRPVFFRSPNEMIAALKAKVVKAIVGYVPLIQKLGEGYHALHWFGENHPNHPCCDIVVNTDRMDQSRLSSLKELMDAIGKCVEAIDSPKVIEYACQKYDLDQDQARDAILRTKFRLGLDPEGKAFEAQLMRVAVDMGYLNRVPSNQEIYLELP
jgi:ABC-type nitrate/sulfonate/bicarbonate transport system substrate-binding protein